MAQRPAMTPGEESIAFHYAMGTAITQWAFIENDLYLIALACFDGRDPHGALGSGFMSIENFRSKVAFVDRTFSTATFKVRFAPQWVSVREAITSLSKTRNAIAHGRCIIYPASEAGRRYALVPNFSKDTRQRKTGNTPNDALCVRDIDLAARRFSMASERLRQLFLEIEGREDLLARPSLREPQPHTLVALRNQIYEALQPPEQSSSG